MPRKLPWTMPAIVLLALTAVGSIGLAYRQGLMPAVINLLLPVDLAAPNAWLIDWRLAALRHDRAQCRRTLRSPHVVARAVPDNPPRKGCGWVNGVHVVSAGGIRASFYPLTCEATAALAMWLEHEVQPLARELLGQRVTSIRSLGGYSCRNIVGNRLWKSWRSQHATANAVDITGFTLADGRQIGVRKHWRGDGAEARFLKAAQRRACRYFRAVLGPEYNAAHRDHLHLDRGRYRYCR